MSFTAIDTADDHIWSLTFAMNRPESRHLYFWYLLRCYDQARKAVPMTAKAIAIFMLSFTAWLFMPPTSMPFIFAGDDGHRYIIDDAFIFLILTSMGHYARFHHFTTFERHWDSIALCVILILIDINACRYFMMNIISRLLLYRFDQAVLFSSYLRRLQHDGNAIERCLS